MALVAVVPPGVVHVATVGAVPVALPPVLGHPLALHAPPDELWLLGHVTSPALACTEEVKTEEETTLCSSTHGCILLN